MIKIFLGNVGSGKSACAVREMILNEANRPTYSNIVTKGVKNNIQLKAADIIKRTVIEPKSGRGQPKVTYQFNKDFWVKVHEKHPAINVILDEAHTLFDSRRAMSKLNNIMNNFMAMLRRILGSNDAGGGELILISQLKNRIDSVAREMATQIRWHVCHYRKTCQRCGFGWAETNETPIKLYKCPRCKEPYIKKENHIIEVWMFSDMNAFEQWRMFRAKTYFRRFYVKDIERYFTAYSTLQFDDLISTHMDDV